MGMRTINLAKLKLHFPEFLRVYACGVCGAGVCVCVHLCNSVGRERDILQAIWKMGVK